MTSWLRWMGVAACALSLACDDGATDEQGAAEDPAAEDPSAAETAAPGEAEAEEGAAAEGEGPSDGPAEACARAIVVAYDGAAYASSDIERSKEEAKERAEALHKRAQTEDFPTLAKAESDAASSGPRGGMLGTYTREAWPSAHAALEDTVFALDVGEVSDVVEAPYGYAIAKRCPVDKVHTRHILIRYEGAKNAAGIERSKQEAKARAKALRKRLAAGSGDFAALARDHSEDGSAERGGDLGEVARGFFAPEYEAVAFELEPGELGPVVETEFGYHVIERVE